MRALLLVLVFYGLAAASASDSSKDDVATTGTVSPIDPVGERHLP